MSSSWRDEDEDYKVGGVRGGLRSKPRFSFAEVKLLLEAVKRNRYIILRKFNQGVSAEAKKQTWAEITEQVNSLGENRREVRQIMKKWADLKCDGKRRIAALRGPNGTSLRKKRLGAVEKMVHKILSMSPRGDGDSDVEFGEDDDFSKGTAPAYSYLSIAPTGINLDFSPLSSPEKELGGDPLQSSSEFDMADEGEPIMDFDENDDSLVSSNYSSLPPASSSSAPAEPPPDDARLRIKPLHTYSRNNGQNPNHTSPKSPPGPSSPVASTSDAVPPPVPSESPTAAGRPSSSSSISAAFAAPPPPASPSSTAAASDSTSPPAAAAAPSAKPLQPPSSSALPQKAPCDPFPAPAFARRPQEQVAQLAAQSVQQQQASRALLSSVSQSLEVLAQSVQLLVESQQEFVQESLLLQRETVDILRDFSNTALSMLREKSAGGQTARHQNPPF